MIYLALRVTPGEEFTGLFIFLIILAAIFLFGLGGLEALKKFMRFRQDLKQEDEIFHQGDTKD